MQSAVMPLAVAVHVTVVCPAAKDDPDWSPQLMDGVVWKFIGTGSDQVTTVDVWSTFGGHISDAVPSSILGV